MRFALPVVFLILLTAVIVFSHEGAPVIDDAPDLSLPVYSACAADADCGFVARPCASPAAVRKDRLKELRYYYQNVRRPVCPAETPPQEAVKAVCIENRCAAAQPDDMPEETK
ncbi:MAG: hypothetical protein H3C49_07695 [Alphaproteobacteria bacterium]|nr:hypothetical protein [Alphaproteobacteria bacterium]